MITKLQFIDPEKLGKEEGCGGLHEKKSLHQSVSDGG